MSLYKTEESRTGADFLRVIRGKLVRQVPEGTAGAIQREYEVLGTGEKKTVWELHYPAIEGLVTDAGFVELQNGWVMEVAFQADEERAKVSLPFPGRLTQQFIQRAVNLDLERPVTLRAGWDKDKGPNGSNFIWMEQGGRKVKCNFTKDNPGGCPPLKQKTGVGGRVTWDSEELDQFFYDTALGWFAASGFGDTVRTVPAKRVEPQQEEQKVAYEPPPKQSPPKQATFSVVQDVPEDDDDIPF